MKSLISFVPSTTLALIPFFFLFIIKDSITFKNPHFDHVPPASSKQLVTRDIDHSLAFIPAAKDELHKVELIRLTDAIGPESIVFDRQGQGPYVSVSGGRILRWGGRDKGWVEFGFTSLRRNEESCMSGLVSWEDVCGRPLGLQFDMETGELYVADAYFGLMVIGKEGGVAKPLVTQAEGQLLRFANHLDIDQEQGVVYFTDSSAVYQRRQFSLAGISGDNTGRLMSYNTKTQQVKVLLRGIALANGVAMSRDSSFVLISEATSGKILKLMLKGPEAGKVCTFATVPGFPDNIRRNLKGEFWVAVHARKGPMSDFLQQSKLLRRLILNLPIDIQYWYKIFMAKKSNALAVKLGEDGTALDVLEDRHGRKLKYISEVQEYNGTLWIGSISMPYVALYKL